MPFPSSWSSDPWAQTSGSYYAPYWRVWEFYAAAMEREIVGGGTNSAARFPRPAMPWFAGHADEITPGPSGTTTVRVSAWARVGVKPPLDPITNPNPPPVVWDPGMWTRNPAINPALNPTWPTRFDLVLEDPDLDPRDAARFPILDNDEDTLTVSDPLGDAPDLVGRNAFIVQRLGSREGFWWWDRAPQVPTPSGVEAQPWDDALAWYRSHLNDARFTHSGDGEDVTTTAFPSEFTEINDSSSPTGTRRVRIFDTDDVRDDISDDENPFGLFSTPRFYRAWRGLQVWAENQCRYWVPPDDYQGARSIPNFCPATFFVRNGIGWSASTTVPTSGTATVTVPNDFFHRVDEVHFALVERSPDLRNVIADGTGPVASGAFTYAGSPFVADPTPCDPGNLGDSGRVLYVAAGWTRTIDAEVRYLYPATWFEPEPGEDGTPVEPTVEAPGSWWTRPASTRNLEYTALGYPGEGSEFPNTIPVSASGTPTGYVRYAGDRRNEDLGGDESAWALYLTKRGDWTYTADEQAMMNGQVVASGIRGQVRTDRNLWRWGPGLSFAATPDAITSTTITDATSATTHPGLWTSPGRYLGHTVRILQPGGGPHHDTRRRITSFDPAGSLGFAAVPGLDATYLDADGATQETSYEIVEPRYRLNYWQGRTLVLATPSGDRRFPILGNDDHCLYYDDPDTTPTIAASGWAFRIESFEPGQCVRRNGGQWTPVPSGLDPRGVIPAQLTRYGRARKWDTFEAHVPNELQRGINSLRWRKLPVIWYASDTREAGDDTPNKYGGGGGPVTIYADPPGGWGGVPLSTAATTPPMKDEASTTWDTLIGVVFPQTEPGPPYAFTDTQALIWGDSSGGEVRLAASLNRRFAWPWVEGIPNGFPGKRLAGAAEIFVKATCPPSRSTRCGTLTPGWSYPVDFQSTFDDFGDFGPSLVRDAYALTFTLSGTDEVRVGPQCGSSAKPPWCDDSTASAPTSPTEGEVGRYRGYEVVDAVAVVKYDGAFGYLPPD